MSRFLNLSRGFLLYTHCHHAVHRTCVSGYQGNVLNVTRSHFSSLLIRKVHTGIQLCLPYRQYSLFTSETAKD
jgi:hypothetical protein